MRGAWLTIAFAIFVEVALAADPKHFVTLHGDAYFSVEVTRRDGLGVAFTHRDGVAYVEFANMSEPTKRAFGFDPVAHEAGLLAKEKQELAKAEAESARMRAEAAMMRAEAAVAAEERKRIEAVAAAAEKVSAVVVAKAVTEERRHTPPPPISSRDYSARDYSAPRSDAPRGGGRCSATTKKGIQCTRNAEAGSARCWQH